MLIYSLGEQPQCLCILAVLIQHICRIKRCWPAIFAQGRSSTPLRVPMPAHCSAAVCGLSIVNRYAYVMVLEI